MEAIDHSERDLARVDVMRAAEGRAVVEREALVPGRSGLLLLAGHLGLEGAEHADGWSTERPSQRAVAIPLDEECQMSKAVGERVERANLGWAGMKRIGRARCGKERHRTCVRTEPAVLHPRDVGQHDAATWLPAPARRVDGGDRLCIVSSEAPTAPIGILAVLERSLAAGEVKTPVSAGREPHHEDLHRDARHGRRGCTRSRDRGEQGDGDGRPDRHRMRTATVPNTLKPGSRNCQGIE